MSTNESKWYAVSVDEETGAIGKVGEARRTEAAALARLPFPAFAVEATGKPDAREVARERAIAWAEERKGAALVGWFACGLNEQGDSMAGDKHPTAEAALEAATLAEEAGVIEEGTAIAVKATEEIEAREAIDLLAGDLPEDRVFDPTRRKVQRVSMIDRMIRDGIEVVEVETLVLAKSGILHADSCHFVRRNPDAYAEVSEPAGAIESALVNWPEAPEGVTLVVEGGAERPVTGVCGFCTVAPATVTEVDAAEVA